MIGHDEMERNGCVNNRLQPLLCDFHLAQAYYPKLRNIDSISTSEKEEIVKAIENIKNSTDPVDVSAAVADFMGHCNKGK